MRATADRRPTASSRPRRSRPRNASHGCPTASLPRRTQWPASLPRARAWRRRGQSTGGESVSWSVRTHGVRARSVDTSGDRSHAIRCIRGVMLRSSLAVLVIFTACACSDTDPPKDPTWQLVQEDLPGGLLRVWGRNARDVYAVGADGDGQESLVIHFDGEKWTRLHPG